MSSLNLLCSFKLNTSKWVDFQWWFPKWERSIYPFKTRSSLPAQLRSTPSVISVVEGRFCKGVVSRKRGWKKDSTKPITEPRMTYFVPAKRAEIVCCCFWVHGCARVECVIECSSWHSNYVQNTATKVSKRQILMRVSHCTDGFAMVNE